MSAPTRNGDPHPPRDISNEDLRAELDEIVAEYPERRAGALMCMHRIQQYRGCVSLADQILLSGVLGISPAHVRELVTFYTMFYEKTPGHYHLQLCRTLSCRLRGAQELTRCVEKRLGIRPGEVTADGRFRLTEVECLAACGTAPVVQVNDDYFEDLSVEGLEALLDDLASRPGPAHEDV